MIGPGHRRPEAPALDRPARGDRQRAQGAAVEAPQEADDAVAPGVVPRHLDRRLVGLGAGVGEEGPLRPAERRQRRHLLAQLHLRLVVEVGARHVQELLRLLDDRLHHLRMRVAGGVDGDAGGAVEEDVAVDVLHGGAAAPGHHERIAAGVGRRHHLAVALDDRPGLGARQRGLELWRVHRLSSRHLRFHRVPCGPSSTRIAQPRQLVADAVRGGEITAAPRLLPLGHAPFDLGFGHARLGVLAGAERHHADDVVEVAEGVADQGDVGGAEGARVDRRVHRPHQLEHRPQRGRGVQVVAHGVVEVGAALGHAGRHLGVGGRRRRPRHHVETAEEVGQPAHLIENLLESVYNNGVHKILIINGHDGNTVPIEIAARNTKDRYPNITIACLESWWELIGKISPDTFNVWDGLGHGGEAETSAMMTIRPDLVNKNNIPEETIPNLPKHIRIFWTMDELTKTGATGSPNNGSFHKRGCYL